MSNQTFTIIKPDAIKAGNLGPIIEKITKSGFQILGLKMIHFTQEKAEDFYGVHKGKEFYERLVNFMISGPSVVAVLQKNNAVEDFRTLVGSTNPDEAAEGTIRKLYATTVTFNAVHGSDSDENAQLEAAHFFNQEDLVSYS